MAGGLQQSQSQHPSWQQQSTSEGGREEGKSAKTRVFSFINHHLSLSLSLARALSRVSTRMHEADARLRGGLTEIHLHSFSFSWRYRLVGCRRFVSFVVSEVSPLFPTLSSR